eukprot:scaffold117932_cov51-Phaeocystis_antarctica.AAC.3
MRLPSDPESRVPRDVDSPTWSDGTRATSCSVLSASLSPSPSSPRLRPSPSLVGVSSPAAALMAAVPSSSPTARRVASPCVSSPSAALAHAIATASTLTGGRSATLIG